MSSLDTYFTSNKSAASTQTHHEKRGLEEDKEMTNREAQKKAKRRSERETGTTSTAT